MLKPEPNHVRDGPSKKVDTGFDREMWLDFYRDSQSDMRCIETTEVKELMRRAHAVGMQQGYLCILQEVLAMGQNWNDRLRSVRCPVMIYQGAQDPTFTPDFVRDAVDHLPNFSLTTVDDTGQLLLYQRPDLVFEALSSNPP